MLSQSRGALFLSVISGILLTLSFPKINFSFLAWVGFLPFFIAIENQPPKKAFFFGWLTGIVHFSTLLYWVTVSMTNYGGLPLLISLSILALLSIYLGLYIGIFGGVLSFFRCRYFYNSIFIPSVVWVLLEYLRTYLLSGFPWGILGYSQFLHLYLIQISDLTGVYGISFLIVLVNGTFYLITRWIRFRNHPFPIFSVIVTVIILGGVIFYGNFRISELKEKNKGKPSFQVALIQGNIDQAQKWDPAYLKYTLLKYRALTYQAIKRSKVNLVIWPETAVPCYFSPEKEPGPFLRHLCEGINTPLLFGSVTYEKSAQGKDKYYNSAFLLSPRTKEIVRYDKVHLVPFGEYVPLKTFLPFVEKLVAGVGDFSPGKKLPLFSVSGAQFGVLICYEIIFPELSRRYCESGGNFLVTITNDAWFGFSSAPYQHFSMAVFRAVENRTGVVRVANSGISGIIEPTGYVQAQTPLFVQTFLRGKVPLTFLPSFYTRYGDVGVGLCGISLLIFMIFNLIREKKIVN